jgi:hypothetical protein
MAKMFSMLVGWVLVIVGLLNFFVAPIKLLPAHAVFHIVAGLLGIWAAKNHAVGYAMWVGVVGVLLALIGFFFGYPTLLGLINLPVWITVIHLVLGVWGLWTYWAATKKPMASGGPATAM